MSDPSRLFRGVDGYRLWQGSTTLSLQRWPNLQSDSWRRKRDVEVNAPVLAVLEQLLLFRGCRAPRQTVALTSGCFSVVGWDC